METNEVPVVETSNKQPKTNWVMSVSTMHEDSGPPSLVQFEETELLSDQSGMGNKVFKAKKVYPKDDKNIPDIVTVKVAGPANADVRNRTAANRLLKIAAIAEKHNGPGSSMFPKVFAVFDPEIEGGSTSFSYAMEFVDTKNFVPAYKIGPDTNSLIEMAVVYADAMEIMMNSSVMQNDRKINDFLWSPTQKRGIILDWDAQIDIELSSEYDAKIQSYGQQKQFSSEELKSATDARIKVLKEISIGQEVQRLGKMLCSAIDKDGIGDLKGYSSENTQGEITTTPAIEEVLVRELPLPMAELIKNLLEKRFQTLAEVKFAAFKIREELKKEAADIFPELDQSATQGSDALARLYSAALTKKPSASVQDKRWMLAVAEMAIEQKSRNPQTEDKFDTEYIRLLVQESKK